MSLKERVEKAIHGEELYFAIYYYSGPALSPEGKVIEQIEETYVLGRKKDNDLTTYPAIGVSKDEIQIVLEDVLLDSIHAYEGTFSAYDVKSINIYEENGKVKVSGKLGEFWPLLPSQGIRYAGKTFTGYVKEIQEGLEEPDIDYSELFKLE